jgi:histidinol-phosphatase (PHP family)
LTVFDVVKMYEAFLKEARSLQEIYADRITLLVGLETEWIHHGTGGEVLDLQKQHQLDYIVGSVHHV